MSQSAAQERNRDRLKAALGVAAFHAVLGYALVTGLGYDVTRTVGESLKVFDVPDEVPPPPEPIVPEEKPSKAPEGAASPENLKGKAAPVVAPTSKVQLKVPPPVRTAPVPGPVPGSDRTAGASDRPGPGTGAGGTGTGTGSGGSGSGSGGGIAARAERISGAIVNADYPRAAKRAGIEGTVRVVYTVGTDGRARDCRVTGSSGSEELDSTTCELVERRFRYRPARDAEGRPVPERVGKVYTWYLPFRRPPFDREKNP